LQRFVKKFSEELQEDFFELVYNSAMKGDLKFFPDGSGWCPVETVQVIMAQTQ